MTVDEQLEIYRRALEEIEQGSPPDDWEYRDSWGDLLGYGRHTNPCCVEEPDPGNRDDVWTHGCAVGEWRAAKIARKALGEPDDE